MFETCILDTYLGKYRRKLTCFISEEKKDGDYVVSISPLLLSFECTPSCLDTV